MATQVRHYLAAHPDLFSTEASAYLDGEIVVAVSTSSPSQMQAEEATEATAGDPGDMPDRGETDSEAGSAPEWGPEAKSEQPSDREDEYDAEEPFTKPPLTTETEIEIETEARQEPAQEPKQEPAQELQQEKQSAESAAEPAATAPHVKPETQPEPEAGPPDAKMVEFTVDWGMSSPSKEAEEAPMDMDEETADKTGFVGSATSEEKQTTPPETTTQLLEEKPPESLTQPQADLVGSATSVTSAEERQREPPEVRPRQEGSLAVRAFRAGFWDLLKVSGHEAKLIDSEGAAIAEIVRQRFCCAAVETIDEYTKPSSRSTLQKYICFCTAVLRRDASFKQALPLQIAIAWMNFPIVKIFVVTFLEDQNLTDWLAEKFGWAQQAGILYVCSAGEAGLRAAELPALSVLTSSSEGTAAPVSFLRPTGAAAAAMASGSAGSTDLVARAVRAVVPVPVALSWHASKGKNTSHLFCLHVMESAGVRPEDCLLVNLDADNLFSPTYVEQLLQQWTNDASVAKRQSPATGSCPVRVLTGKTLNPACTGRIAITPVEFARLGGYDQEADVLGTGYQDVDLIRRSGQAYRLFQKEHMHRTRDLQLSLSLCVSAGTAFKNEPGIDAKTDRGLAKIRNIDPAQAKGRTWGQMNQANVSTMVEKLGAGRIGRNGVPDKPSFNEEPAELIQRFRALPLGFWFYTGDMCYTKDRWMGKAAAEATTSTPVTPTAGSAAVAPTPPRVAALTPPRVPAQPPQTEPKPKRRGSPAGPRVTFDEATLTCSLYLSAKHFLYCIECIYYTAQ